MQFSFVTKPEVHFWWDEFHLIQKLKITKCCVDKTIHWCSNVLKETKWKTYPPWNSHFRTLKWMVGILSRFLLGPGLFSVVFTRCSFQGPGYVSWTWMSLRMWPVFFGWWKVTRSKVGTVTSNVWGFKRSRLESPGTEFLVLIFGPQSKHCCLVGLWPELWSLIYCISKVPPNKVVGVSCKESNCTSYTPFISLITTMIPSNISICR